MEKGVRVWIGVAMVVEWRQAGRWQGTKWGILLPGLRGVKEEDGSEGRSCNVNLANGSNVDKLATKQMNRSAGEQVIQWVSKWVSEFVERTSEAILFVWTQEETEAGWKELELKENKNGMRKVRERG